MTDVRSEDVTAGGTPRAGAGWAWILAYGVISTVLGLFAFFTPFSATFAAVLTVGVMLVVTGVFSLVAGVFTKGHHHRLYSIVLGVLSIVAGLLTIFRPVSGAVSLTLLIAAWLVVRGVMEIVWGVRHRHHRAAMILLGVLNIIIAVFILATFPLSAATLPGYVLGLTLLFGGVTAIASALAHKKGAPAFSLS
ncbi:HdeD family acid-resistance protein [Sphingomonas lenta]|uniref:HdeD family acid-resistance protein n=1 Tax=Sphingomonas lenta TaxID=1141887 RepID=A0A2A2SJZ9_9SPHN|nr:HdeD family acid-resistance protein [Sphingomonas lenta]PAX09553.1 hypothetical protein CKY28_02065 [Sphingomonas lenta]